MKNKNSTQDRIAQYKKKRRFADTPEPEGAEPKRAEPKRAGTAARQAKKLSTRAGKSAGLRFVVQKHQASHLHYDFRLEHKGALLSWAVPKGPSMDPKIKRLAMQVEDHPLEYRKFHGTIPEGNYGAGTVEIWDNGNYAPLNFSKAKIAPYGGGGGSGIGAGIGGFAPRNRAESERIISSGLRKGHLTFVLNGKKLKGEFGLIKTRFRGENAWLLVKANDQYAKSETAEQARVRTKFSANTRSKTPANTNAKMRAKAKTKAKAKVKAKKGAAK